MPLFKSQKHEPVHQIYDLIHRLGLGTAKQQHKIVAFIAARPREGTTAIARYIANLLASDAKQRILLLDAGPMHSPKHFQALGVSLQDGIVDALVQGRPLEPLYAKAKQGFNVVRWMVNEDALRLEAGRIIQQEDFWERLRLSFDLVLIDAPAVHYAYEGVALASKADIAVLVVEAEKTPPPVVQHLQHTLTEAGAKIAGALLNKRRFYIPQRIYKKI